MAIALAQSVYLLYPRLRWVGLRNLELAFPEKTPHERRRILRREFTGLGRLLAEFCRFPEYSRDNIAQVAVYQGFENFEARMRGEIRRCLRSHRRAVRE